MIWKKDIRRLRRERQVKAGTVYTRVYAAPQQATLAALGIAKGDVLPAATGISDAEIIDVQLTVPAEDGGKALVAIEAYKADLWPLVLRSDPARELAHSRLMDKTADSVSLTRRFEVADDDLAGGAWPAGLPAVGDAYIEGAWSITPRAGRIDLDPAYTPTKTLVTVTYTAYLAWGDVTGG